MGNSVDATKSKHNTFLTLWQFHIGKKFQFCWKFFIFRYMTILEIKIGFFMPDFIDVR